MVKISSLARKWTHWGEQPQPYGYKLDECEVVGPRTLSKRVATRRQCSIFLKNGSVKLRAFGSGLEFTAWQQVSRDSVTARLVYPPKRTKYAHLSFAGYDHSGRPVTQGYAFRYDFFGFLCALFSVGASV